MWHMLLNVRKYIQVIVQEMSIYINVQIKILTGYITWLGGAMVIISMCRNPNKLQVLVQCLYISQILIIYLCRYWLSEFILSNWINCSCWILKHRNIMRKFEACFYLFLHILQKSFIKCLWGYWFVNKHRGN